ncbi:hypothetical protein SAMN05428947_101223 [Mucilaginibacter sp. OK283]|nr:hypothetical protein SAMN05428947_101223 [Mucilaginibacter sp. OK283]
MFLLTDTTRSEGNFKFLNAHVQFVVHVRFVFYLYLKLDKWK